MKRLLLTLALLLVTVSAEARGKLQGWVEKGGASVTSGGFLSTTKVQQSFPSATVTVKLAGTSTNATIYSDAAGTPKANPFTADTTGFWFFWADDGDYDVTFSGSVAYTLSSLRIVGGTPEFSITSFGAKADAGVTNNRVPIQAAITAACASHGKVKVPGATSYYGISGGSLTITCTGLTMEGDGAWSQLYRGEAGDLLQIGDNVTQISDVTIRGISFNGVDASGWSINARKAPNTLIEWNNFANSSTGSGALRMSECWNSRIMNNTVGSLKGVGFRLTDSTNSVPIIGNRIDGHGGGSTTAVGMYLAATTLHLAGNTVEGVNVGIDIVASTTIAIIGNYFENNSFGAGAVDLRTSAGGITTGLSIISNYFAPNGIAYSIDLDLVEGVYIGPNTFANTAAYTAGYPIRINSNAQKVRIDANEQVYVESTDYAIAVGAGINGTIVNMMNRLSGDMTGTRNIARIHLPGGTMMFRLKYHLVADSTDNNPATRDETFGIKTAVAQISTSGAWTQILAWANEVTERSLGTATVLTLGFGNGDFTGGYITVAATNYSGANALAIYNLEVIGIGDGLPTASRP